MPYKGCEPILRGPVDKSQVRRADWRLNFAALDANSPEEYDSKTKR